MKINHNYTSNGKVWSIPTRLFHLFFAASVLLCWLTGEGIIVVSTQIHMWLGGLSLSLVLFRIIWGVCAGDYAHFQHMLRSILKLKYVLPLTPRNTLPSSYPGHSPTGSISVLAMLVLVLLQSVSGLMTSDGIFTDGPLVKFVSSTWVDWSGFLHHRVQYLLLLMMIIHPAAVFYYQFRKKQNIIPALWHGRKNINAESAQERPLTAFVIMVITLSVSVIIFTL